MIATLAWGIACKALGHAEGVAQTAPSELSLAGGPACADMCRSREALNEALIDVGLGAFLIDHEAVTDFVLNH